MGSNIKLNKVAMDTLISKYKAEELKPAEMRKIDGGVIPPSVIAMGVVAYYKLKESFEEGYEDALND